MGSCCGKKGEREEDGGLRREASNPLIKKLKETEAFNTLIKESGDEGKILVADFYAPWCGPCQAMAPHLNKFASEFKDDVIFVKINVDEADELASKYGISSMPTLIVFWKGEKVAEASGANPDKIKAMIADAIMKSLNK